jgi:hypothetical protein
VVALLIAIGSCSGSVAISDGLVSSYRACADGWPSHSIGIQGACSHHGGVVTRKVDERTDTQRYECYALNAAGIVGLLTALILWSGGPPPTKHYAPQSLAATPPCGTPPQISTVPPALPTELRAAKGTAPRIIGIAALGGFVLFLVVLATMAKKPQSTAAPVASSSPLFTTATPAEHFPRAIPVPSVFHGYAASAMPALATYRVIKIPKGDYLNVRTEAGSNYPVIMKLEPGAGGIVLGGWRVANAETMWQEIMVNGRTGWVNADYIAPATQSSASP